jgi:prepilin-type N-terminal cleavage/methylation domain-containing protein
VDWKQEHPAVPAAIYGCRAFTLIEVILVLTLLGILAAFTVPSLLPFNDRWLLRSTAYMMAGDIRRMQRQAVQECAEYNFEIHPSQFYYKIKKNYGTSSPIKKVTLDPRIAEITSTMRVSDYDGSMFGYRILTFSYLGSPYNSGDIILKTRSGSSIKLTIEVTTGRVHIYD